MPIFEVEKDGRKFQVDAPDMRTAAGSLGKLPIDPILPPAQSEFQGMAKDIGRGIARGAARAFEAPPFQPPGTAGQFVQSPAETAEAIEQARGTGPGAFTERHVAPPQTQAGQYAEPIAAAALTAPLQPGGPITKAVTTITGGAGVKAGADIAGALGLDETAGGVVGGIVGGAAGGFGSAEAAAVRARRPSILPTREMNRAGSKAAIAAVEQHGMVLEPTEVTNFTAGLRADLDRALFSPQPGGRGNVGYQAADQIERANGDLATIMNVHGSLGTVTPGEGPNYAAAVQTREAIRDWVASNPATIRGDPNFISTLWAQHRDTWRVHSNLEEIEGALNSAEWRRMVSGRGSNLNTARQQIRKILDSDSLARRYSPEARAQMERVVEGDLARNSLRRIAGFAPHGAVTAVPALWELTMHGAGAAAGFTGVTFLAHFLQHRLEDRSINQLLDIIRVGSPLHTGAQRAARARLLVPRTGVATARGALAAGAGSPMAEPEEAPLAHPGL